MDIKVEDSKGLLDSFFEKMATRIQDKQLVNDSVARALERFKEFNDILTEIAEKEPEIMATFVYFVLRNTIMLVNATKATAEEITGNKGLWAFINSLPFDYEKVKMAMRAEWN